MSEETGGHTPPNAPAPPGTGDTADVPSPPSCICLTENFRSARFDRRWLPGMDPTRGRYADVAVDRCRTCGRYWLSYEFEFESFSRSGRWYRGLITPEAARTVTPETAAAVLEGLPWYFAGGSWFGGRIHRRSGRLEDWPG